MYYETPVIIVPNENTIDTFGNKCDFGYYLKNSSNEEIKKAMEYIDKCELKEYEKMCVKAHELVKDFKWENYIKKIMQLF